ncbi:hypothetical protein Q428_01485 [Fervidicella metallireducens AeB]|uniref:Alkaline shock response membrane anchor protein AmaP n=1 Tax=Fervidicella metallireducens AeB TaxID=1403537 RepID=A0A017RY86_9CLOT|nr:alkaline shock response membrane anchor protein AmaP [Fervidicella metallireducens]EYE89743.1 hypothetical protein Q428_01485 [Fervidicella metallireducens AeB]
MKTLDKFLMFVYLLVLTAFFGSIILIPFGYIPRDYVERIVNNLFETSYFALIAAAFILLNIKLLISLVAGERRGAGVIKYTEGGMINITNETIKSMAIKTASQSRGIRDINVMVKPGKDNIDIMIKGNIMPDINVTETVKEIQQNVKTYIETIAEIPVGEVKVIITDVAAGNKLRLS